MSELLEEDTASVPFLLEVAFLPRPVYPDDMSEEILERLRIETNPVEVEVTSGTLVQEVYEILHGLYGFPTNDQHLIYNGRVLRNDKTLGEYGVEKRREGPIRLYLTLMSREELEFRGNPAHAKARNIRNRNNRPPLSAQNLLSRMFRNSVSPQMVSGSPSSGEEVFRRLLAGDDDDDEEEPSVVPGDDNGGSSGTPNLQNISSPLDIISSLLGFPQNRPPVRNRQNFSLFSDGEGESSGPVQNLMNLFGTPVNSGNAGSAVQSAPRSSSNVQRGANAAALQRDRQLNDLFGAIGSLVRGSPPPPQQPHLSSSSSSSPPNGESYEEQIQDMLSMGFENRQVIEEALRETGGNIADAIDYIASMPESSRAASDQSNPSDSSQISSENPSSVKQYQDLNSLTYSLKIFVEKEIRNALDNQFDVVPVSPQFSHFDASVQSSLSSKRENRSGDESSPVSSFVQYDLPASTTLEELKAILFSSVDIIPRAQEWWLVTPRRNHTQRPSVRLDDNESLMLYEILSSWGKTDFVLYVREIELSGDEETPLHIPQDTDVTIFFKFFDRRNRCLRFLGSFSVSGWDSIESIFPSVCERSGIAVDTPNLRVFEEVRPNSIAPHDSSMTFGEAELMDGDILIVTESHIDHSMDVDTDVERFYQHLSDTRTVVAIPFNEELPVLQVEVLQNATLAEILQSISMELHQTLESSSPPPGSTISLFRERPGRSPDDSFDARENWLPLDTIDDLCHVFTPSESIPPAGRSVVIRYESLC